MKKTALFMIVIVLINVFSPSLTGNCDELTEKLYISKTGEMWDNYINMMNIVFTGGKISGLYYHKLYAEYESSVGGFVVKEKAASHISYTKEVGNNSFGLCFSYNPEYKEGNEFGKVNYSVWSKIRVGDILHPHGIDFTSKTIRTEGTLKEGNLKTEAYFTVTYTKKKVEPTAYSGKTIVALGDSVTCNGGWTEKLSDLIGCRVINSGVSADRATEALLRFERDVESYSPNIVLVMLGINDCVQYHYSNKTVENFKNELRQLYSKCKNIGAKVIFVSPNNIKTEKLNFERYKNYGGLSKCYPLFIRAVEEVAAETNSYYVNVYQKFENTDELLCDSVHPNSKGYEIIWSAISDFLISYGDRICAEEISGYVSTGVYNFKANDFEMYLPLCTVNYLKTFFCVEIKVYNEEREIDDMEYIKEGYTICWLDKNSTPREKLKIILRE